MIRGMRFRPLTAVLLVALLALAGCLPSDGAPGSPGVPVLGVSRLSAEQLVAYYRSHAPASLPYRVPGASLEQLAQMFVDEGNRYLVRGDVAFAQSIVETGWFNFPDHGIVKPGEQQLRGHRRVQLVRERDPVRQRIERCARPDPAAPQLRRRHLAHEHASRSSGARALGEHAGDRRRTTSTTSSPRGTRRSGTTWGTATGPARPTTRPSCCASTTTCSSPAGNRVSARRMSCSSARSPSSGRARWGCANRAAPSRRRRAAASTC